MNTLREVELPVPVELPVEGVSLGTAESIYAREERSFEAARCAAMDDEPYADIHGGHEWM